MSMCNVEDKSQDYIEISKDGMKSDLVFENEAITLKSIVRLLRSGARLHFASLPNLEPGRREICRKL